MTSENIFNKDDIILINDITYKIIKLIGHGKGGYSYLATDGKTKVVIKKIHHEPCSYYNFGDKIQSELNDYNTLFNIGIKKDISKYIGQLREFLPTLYNSNINIDYYPTNFVVNSINDLIYYIDYECNIYDSKRDFDNWGIKYWNGEEAIN